MPPSHHQHLYHPYQYYPYAYYAYLPPPSSMAAVPKEDVNDTSTPTSKEEDKIEGSPPRKREFVDAEKDGTKAPLNNGKISPKKKPKRIRRKCSAPNCQNQVVQGGVCITHGAKRKSCSHPGCAKAVKLAGFCSTHGPARKKCESVGCTRVAQRGGKCITHGVKRIAIAVGGEYLGESHGAKRKEKRNCRKKPGDGKTSRARFPHILMEEEESESKEEKSEEEEESVQPFSGRRHRRGVGGWKDGPARFDRRKL